ncbi:MAG: CocE/NonD family hydrolase, partial [Ignavibacteriales bacterium]|nr:CocE/NonD family hydrolase [Ignavibacteriales bacterium]
MQIKHRALHRFLVLFLFLSLVLPGFAAAFFQANPSDVYDRIEARIRMRDDVRLYTEIYVPRDVKAPLPFLMIRTPYNATGTAQRLNGSLRELANERYIFVFQDIRGRYKSQGTFMMMRPPSKDLKGIDEGTDAYDTIEWLLNNVRSNNGRVGIFGVSYPGWLTVMAMLNPHPALKAASPQASPGDMFLGDDFHHNGAFRLSYGFEYAFRMEASSRDTAFVFDQYDTYEWYLKLGPLSNVNAKYFHGAIPTWNNYGEHPNYDEFWQNLSVLPHLTRVTVPALHVVGWWDQEDFFGPLKIYEELEKHDMNNQNFLVAGPWNHGGWNWPRGDKLGNVDFDSTAPSLYFRERIQAPWFAYHLKDKDSLNLPEAHTFQTGANRWMSYDTWPPRSHFAMRNLYLHPGGNLSFEPPSAEGESFTSYLSDPRWPAPY